MSNNNSICFGKIYELTGKLRVKYASKIAKLIWHVKDIIKDKITKWDIFNLNLYIDIPSNIVILKFNNFYYIEFNVINKQTNKIQYIGKCVEKKVNSYYIKIYDLNHNLLFNSDIDINDIIAIPNQDIPGSDTFKIYEILSTTDDPNIIKICCDRFLDILNSVPANSSLLPLFDLEVK